MSEPNLQILDHHIGIDVSGWQPVIDYDAAKRGGVEFCWVKSSEGDDHQSPTASLHVRGCEESGIEVGVYHYATPATGGADDPVREAEFLVQEVIDLAATDLRPVIDYEQRVWSSRARNTDWVLACAEVVERELGVGPILYSGASFLRGRYDWEQIALSRLDAWVAAYLLGVTHEQRRRRTERLWERRGGPRIPVDPVAHQWTSRARPSWAYGSKVDINCAPYLARLRWPR